jgi:imidazolonepropionase-like amidohydrolase
MKITICDLRFTNRRHFASTTVAGLVLLLATGASAETLLLKGATVHTVSGETIPAGEVFIRDGKIAAVGKSVGTGDAKVVDLAGLHLYPGMIALDTALGLKEIGAVRATVDEREVGEFTPDVQSWIAVNPDSELLPVARANGVSHFEPAPQGAVVAGQSALVALDGWTTEQMVVKKPLALHVFWPNVELSTTPKDQARDKAKWKSLDEQAKERIAKFRALDDFFKEAQAYAKAKDAAGKGQAEAPTPDPSWEAMVPFVRGERPLVIHADEIRQIKAALAWAATNHWKIILAGGRDAWRAADALAQAKVPVIYEHVFTQPVRDTDAYDVHFRAPEVLRQAGVTVVFGTGVDSASLVKNLPFQAAQAVAFGFPANEAVKGLTLYPAQLAGVADRLGSIEAGKDATFFAMDDDILDIRANVKRMWIAGKEVSLESRHTRLYEKYKNRPKAK